MEKNDDTGTTRYVYDLKGSVIAETNQNGAFKTFHVPGLSYTDAVTNQRFYYRANGLGSQVALTTDRGTGKEGSNNNIVSRTEYDGYGKGYALTPSTDTRGTMRFAGKHGYVTDAQSGMQLLGARYYLPALGRFLTQDPIGQADRLNLYTYADNNPLSKIDPTGLWVEDDYRSTAALRRHLIAGVPLGPPRSDLFRDIAIAQRARYAANMAMIRGSESHVVELQLRDWFKTQVENFGPWDYKRHTQTVTDFGDKTGKGVYNKYEHYGNFSYGATGAAAGLSLKELLLAAGVVQVYSKNSQLAWWGSGFDEPADVKDITAGFNWYTARQKK